MDAKREIIKKINNTSGRFSAYDFFTDWVTCMAISIQNSCCVFRDSAWKMREKRYMDIIQKYEGDERRTLVEMTGLLVVSLEERMGDILGEVYMESGCGNKNTGQFFTPYNVSKMSAALTLKDQDLSRETISLSEPSCGAGGMIIAAADVLRERGVDYQRKLRVVAQDLDWKAVYMCYVQLSFLGIDAIVVQGDTLAEPYTGDGYPRDRVFLTPRRMGVLL